MMSSAAETGAPAAPTRLRAQLRAARRGVLPVLGVGVGVFVAGYARPAFGGLLPLASGWWGVSVVVVWPIILALPFLLFAASGLRPRGGMRALVAACFALYAAAIVRPITMLAFGAAELAQQQSLDDGDPGAELRYSLAYVRAHPHAEAEARKAVAWGDERYYGMGEPGWHPPGIHWSMDGWFRYGMKELPGFSDLEGEDPRAEAEVACWAFRYDTALVHLRPVPGVKRGDELDPFAMTRWVRHDCDPAAASR